MNKYDLTLLENLTTGETAKSVTLFPETVALCLMALDDRAIYQGAWVDDGDTITSARWDIAKAYILDFGQNK